MSKFNYKIYLLILAFTTGLTIMAVELTASRLIAPYYGTSTFIWTNIIGVIMVALAVGYYIGGKLADKYHDLKLILKVILLACFILILIPFLVKPLVVFINQSVLVINSASLFLFMGSFITISLLFILPILLLGMVSPYLIKLLSINDKHIGTDAGLIFSVSTFGSILGTFLPVLVFIPIFGTRKTILIFSFILIFVVALGLIKKKWHLLIVLIIVPFLFMKMSVIKTAEGAVYEDESVYQYFQVIDKNNLRYLKINEGLASHSIINTNENEVLTGSYYDYVNLLPYLSGNDYKQDILILGLACGTVSTQLDYFFSQNYDLSIDGVEIDKKIIDVGYKYFDMANKSLKVFNMDGRTYLDLNNKKYNAIFIDVYSNQLYIPFHLTTIEFFESVKNKLKENGVIAMNVNATSSDSQLLNNITNTMNMVFDYVYYIQEKENDWNYIVMASQTELDLNKLNQDNSIKELEPIIGNSINNNIRIFYNEKYNHLTDDLAPIEHLTDWMVLDYIFKNIK